jgi:hypothetical protein
LFTSKQPSEDGGDHSNADLAAIAKDSGASGDAQQCIAKGDRFDSARDHAQAALVALKSQVGQVQTPTVLSGNKSLDVNDKDWVNKVAP